MIVDDLDPVIEAWATRHRLRWSTRHRDAPVRSIETVGLVGRAQICLELGEGITVWDYRDRRWSCSASLDELEQELDAALVEARAWCDGPVA